MTSESSFDIVCKVPLQEVDNAIQQALKEIVNRFDFRGSKTELRREEHEITLESADNFKAKSALAVFHQRLTRRGISVKALQVSEPEPAAGARARIRIKLQNGIPQEKSKEMVRLIKDTKMKVQVSIQGDQVRVKGKNKDDLQAVIQLLEESKLDIDMQFVNYR
ncbi:MAG: YajQ family cyclic di-GMP-binding protein [Acidobacteriota bacterium]|nr:YajQ family cyclic di-GMP-binding protein [Acidobacteriota bacterium]